MIRKSIIAAAVAASALLAGAGVANAGSDEPLGTYSVPGGTLTVWSDGHARFEPTMKDGVMGWCGVDDTNATTGEWHEPNYGCVPYYAPDGVALSKASADDGSGSYDGSRFYFDADGGHIFVAINPVMTCWDEPKATLPTETVCGDKSLAPAGAVNFRSQA